jgi:DNA-binding XRE family transcriptional regulator
MQPVKTFLNQMLVNKNITQTQLSLESGVTQQVISKLITAVTKTPSRKTAVQLARYFEVTTDEIYHEGNHHVL